MEGYTCAYGRIFDGEEYIDDAVITVFREPKSYTGENVAEISCHGGLYITRRILRIALKTVRGRRKRVNLQKSVSQR